MKNKNYKKNKNKNKLLKIMKILERELEVFYIPILILNKYHKLRTKNSKQKMMEML